MRSMKGRRANVSGSDKLLGVRCTESTLESSAPNTDEFTGKNDFGFELQTGGPARVSPPLAGRTKFQPLLSVTVILSRLRQAGSSPRMKLLAGGLRMEGHLAIESGEILRFFFALGTTRLVESQGAFLNLGN
jgi:hypothetical protein